MPVFVLYMKMEMENVAEVSWGDDMLWCVDLQQSGGNEVRSEVVIDTTEEQPLEGSRGTANFVMKWSKSDRKGSSVTKEEKKGGARFITEDDVGKWVPVAAFDCRGADIIKYHPRDGFTVTTTGGAVFKDVDLSEEWADYDEENDLSVSIMEVETKVETTK
ncbi:hypothetical protein PTSG_09395 [Salpingoeca rosetta]|uniref:Uncharacterized protein n=1 Tax=Salpingoeca rosetta (strain ATCC 50818 / BSB-021) TaxID=946362 RepID=F2UMI0_SALR5|nr:uncharacterized protein PTSG_09395 [Salpingoeca rosetta]EGD78329.1 hypothetical protein PTSG_09395 [Salpingoeca rosetta]|eukprot:XP_004989652.1 hypothetical protein PTSG_09395 [Salpingoeca rosetta]